MNTSEPKRDYLQLSEKFFSIQGEGWTTGVPAYFIRLTGCNLSCGFSNKGIVALSKHIKALDENVYRAGGFDHEFADLYKDGKATWVCDSASVWLKGQQTPFNDLVREWENLNIKDWVREQRTHLIWTGGEPTMPSHQASIVNFLDWLSDYHSIKPFNEIETNGTIYIGDRLFEKLDQINCSVKLGNSGMKESKRIVPDAIHRIMEHHNYWFKFVISTEDDLKEIIRDFVEPFSIPALRILMMPGLDRQENYFERTNFVLEMAKKYGFTGLTRLHVAGWNQLTGV
ncbi:7-carboxy-7-deazaguanine synthase QueE [bacterium]|nr:7-carboxy-7-deazaguanine synthase QueE [bacterium]